MSPNLSRSWLYVINSLFSVFYYTNDVGPHMELSDEPPGKLMTVPSTLPLSPMLFQPLSDGKRE